MKKKIGIMSMQRIINYGSYLQAFALSNTIKKLGNDVEFVDFKIEPCIVEPYQAPTINEIETEHQDGYKWTYDFADKFEKKYLPELGVTEHRNERPKLDTLVIGSDEVFNCLQNNPNCGYSLELFGKDHNAKKIISYAASCGNTSYEKIVNFNKQDEISELLNKFDAISVRDRNSQKFVKKLSNIEPTHNLDPVLIYDFSKDKLDNVKIDNYIIVYAYSLNLDDEVCNKIKQFAKKHNKKIVTIGSYQKCSDLVIDAHPLEVLPYFEKADFVITNTFHGTIFSIISHTPFATFIRKDYNNEKLSDLLERLEFTNRIISSYDELESMYSTSMDFTKSDEIRKKEKERTIEYLKNNL